MSHFAAIAAAALIAAIWQGVILAAVVALTLRLLPALSAATRSLMWTATFALLVALHFLPALHPAPTASGTAHPLYVAPIWSVALMLVWLVLSLFRAVQFGLGVHRLREIDRRATPVTTPLRPFERTPELPASELSWTEGLTGRGYTLCTSPDVDRPSVLGFFRPRILLPAGLLESLTPAELQQILLHETEHLRRSDDWTNLLQKLALVLFPLNPVLFWVERRMCLERELACDQRVLSAGENLRKAYATTLTRLAEHSILRRGMNLALGILGQRPRPSELSTRVHRILTRPAKSLTGAQTRLVSATVLGGLLALSTTLAHAPSLIAFAPEGVSRQAARLGVSGLAAANWVPARAVVAREAQPAYRTVEAVAHLPVAATRRAKKAHPLQRAAATPRVIETSYRQPQPDAAEQPRLTLMVDSGTQVQQFVVPAVASVPAAYVPAYAAIRTPDGWIIFQL